MPGLESALSAGDLAKAEAAVPWDLLEEARHEIRPELKKALDGAAGVAARLLEPHGVTVALSQTNTAAVEWARSHSADLVKAISDTSRQAVRGIIVNSFEEGITARNAARLIRDQVGLLPQHARAVEKYRMELLKKGFSAAEAERKAGRYAQKLIRYRAGNIARTESIRATSRGQRFLWDQAVQDGELVASEWERVWITSPTENTCEICIGLNGTRAPLQGGTFPGGYEEPPDPHPSCQCAHGIDRALQPKPTAPVKEGPEPTPKPRRKPISKPAGWHGAD